VFISPVTNFLIGKVWF